MKLLDANVLLYAYNADSPHHAASRAWLESALNDAKEAVAFPWQSVLAFARIVTNPRAVNKPLTSETACAIARQWLEHPNVIAVGYGERFWPLFCAQVDEAKVSGPLVSDAALAAVALEQGATLCSTDKDFRRFAALKLIDPLQAPSRQQLERNLAIRPVSACGSKGHKRTFAGGEMPRVVI